MNIAVAHGQTRWQFDQCLPFQACLQEVCHRTHQENFNLRHQDSPSPTFRSSQNHSSLVDCFQVLCLGCDSRKGHRHEARGLRLGFGSWRSLLKNLNSSWLDILLATCFNIDLRVDLNLN